MTETARERRERIQRERDLKLNSAIDNKVTEDTQAIEDFNKKMKEMNEALFFTSIAQSPIVNIQSKTTKKPIIKNKEGLRKKNLVNRNSERAGISLIDNISEEIEVNGSLEEKILEDFNPEINEEELIINKKEKKIKTILSQLSRKSREKQLNAYVTEITKERIELIYNLENRNKSDIIEQAIEEYQKKHHPNLKLKNKEWKSFFGAYSNA